MYHSLTNSIPIKIQISMLSRHTASIVREGEHKNMARLSIVTLLVAITSWASVMYHVPYITDARLSVDVHHVRRR
jgi:hypothetical protein